MKSCKPFGSGHINDTYRVVTNADDFILQRINNKVFRTNQLFNNYEVLVNSVSEYEQKTAKKITPQIYKTKSGNYHHVDGEDCAWRLVELIPDAESYDICPEPMIAYKAAKAIGDYQLFLNTIDPSLFQDTIVGFHNLPKRFGAFQDAVQNAKKHLLKSSEKELSETLELGYIVNETLKSLDGLPVRINHNDTKLNNVLFKDDEVLVIDLDTVMSGNVMFDFGDMVRTFTSPALEDERAISKTDFQIDHFEALTRGYLESLKNDLTVHEKSSLYYGALYIIYEQVLRFLTDYLKGNVYYKVAYPDHNLVRTRTQLKLLGSVIQHQSELKRMIEQYS